MEFPGTGVYKVFHFHADFVTPAKTTFTLFASPAAAGFTGLCTATRACVPQLRSPAASNLDGIGDRLMHRLAYRNLGPFESVVGNFSVSSGGVAGVRWFELRNVTAGPVTVFQESTYQPDTAWRWMGSVAQDHQGNLALGFSTSSSAINPQIRYAGRLVTDTINTLGQGEAHLFDGTGSQTGTGNRWGDYSAMSIDPVDDCTFWYTQEYYSTTTTFNWRTRIGNFKFPGCIATPTPTPTRTPTPTPTLPPPSPTFHADVHADVHADAHADADRSSADIHPDADSSAANVHLDAHADADADGHVDTAAGVALLHAHALPRRRYARSDRCLWGAGAPCGCEPHVRFSGRCGIPPTAISVALNAVAVQPTDGPGFFTLFPGGTLQPLTSTINYNVGNIRANNAIIPVGTLKDIAVHCQQGTGTAHMVIDVNGYFAP